MTIAEDAPWFKFTKYGVAFVSLATSLIALAAGLAGYGPGPTWLWIVVAYVALGIGLGLLWCDEHKTAQRYRCLLVTEYREHAKKVKAGKNLSFSSPEQKFKFYQEHIEANDELLREAIAEL